MARSGSLATDIEKAALPICEEIGIELVQVNVNLHKDVFHIQVFADRPTGGIGMEECARLNRALVSVLDNEPDLGDNYTLEVSSPGLDRVLKGFRDLRRVLGRPVQVFLKSPVSGKREVAGTLEAVSENEIIVKARQGELVLAMDNIEKAKQIIN